MSLGTKILLLMLLITIGTSATLAFVVTLNVKRYETQRADGEISDAIARYVAHLDDRHRQVQRIVRALLEAPATRSQLQSLEDEDDPESREQLRQEIFGRTVQTELETPEGAPAFHVLLDSSGKVLLTSAPDAPKLEALLARQPIHWPVDPIINGHDELIRCYIATPLGLFLAMGIPLHTQLDQPPSHAYFVGFAVDDEWTRRQLLSNRVHAGGDAPICAWFAINNKIVAHASSILGDASADSFNDPAAVQRSARTAFPASRSMGAITPIEFQTGGEKYVGQSFDLAPAEASSGTLILASSLDRALASLRDLQRQIALCTVIACSIAVAACQILAGRIVRPIRTLVVGTQRVAAGQFDEPVKVDRSDELGTLARAFNEMAAGLKERDVLRDERTKMQRDLALARKIQMDVLPKSIPPCHGYDIAAYSLPAEQTGGDIYDVVGVTIDDGPPGSQPSLVLLLADATGHGVGPALSVTQVRSMLRIGVRLRAGLDHVLTQINRQLCQDLGAERFVTAFLGLLDPAAHSVSYQSAGQAPLMHFRARDKQVAWLGSSMLPLGIDEDTHDLGMQSILLEPGDLVVLLTDGFYEFQNAGGELFSKERVAEVILRHHGGSAKEILSQLLEGTRDFADGAPQLDDMTALIIKRLPDDSAAAPPAEHSAPEGL